MANIRLTKAVEEMEIKLKEMKVEEDREEEEVKENLTLGKEFEKKVKTLSAMSASVDRDLVEKFKSK